MVKREIYKTCLTKNDFVRRWKLSPETHLLIRDRSFGDRKEKISDSRFSGNVTGKVAWAGPSAWPGACAWRNSLQWNWTKSIFLRLMSALHVLGLQSCRTFSSDCDQKIITGLQLSFRALLLDLYRDSVPSLYGTINPIAPSGASKQKRLTWPLPLRPGKFDADPDQQASADMYWSFFSPSLLTKFQNGRQQLFI